MINSETIKDNLRTMLTILEDNKNSFAYKTIDSALDIITCQQAKIDDLMERTAVTTLIDDAVVYTPTLEDYDKFKKRVKSEAVKEFAERVKEETRGLLGANFIDDLLKERIGDSE